MCHARGRADIDRDDAPVPDEIAHRGEEQGRSPEVGPGFDDEIRLQLLDELLVDPAIERRFEDRDAEPIGLLERAAVKGQKMKPGDCVLR